MDSTQILLESWQQLLLRLGASCDAKMTFAGLAKGYGEASRKYHTFAHVASCLGQFSLVRKNIGRPNIVELAIWFHDYVYDTSRNDNEVQSAIQARKFCFHAGLGTHSDDVCEMILSTRHENLLRAAHVNSDTATLLDIDLSILGSPSEMFAAYERQIREEYWFVPEAKFCERRTRLLSLFLEQDRIYRTPFFRERYEFQARTNLRHSIEELKLKSAA